MRKPGLPKLTKRSMEDAPENQRWVESVRISVNSCADEIDRIRSEDKGIKLLSSADVEMKEFDVQVPDPWHALAMSGGFTDTLRYMKHADGSVEVQFAATGGALGAVATLPIGHRPQNSLTLPFVDSAGAPGVGVQIDNGGGIAMIRDDPGSGEIFGMVRFMAYDPTPVPLSCWPKFIQTKFKSVAGVVVCGMSDLDQAVSLMQKNGGAAYHPVWEMSLQDGKPAIKLLNIAGLPYNRKSRVRLLIFGG